jgi:putative spermidine/putrescine transport system substrate-binding protein
MINRRTLLFGTASIAVTSLLTSCRQAATDALKITLLEGSIPSQVLQSFQKQASNPVSFQMGTQIGSIFQQLQRWQIAPKKSVSLRRYLPWNQDETLPKPDNLVSIGDYWLESAIAQNLISPLELLPSSLEKLPTAWQQFSSRDEKGRLESQVMAQDIASQANNSEKYRCGLRPINFRA